MGILSNSIIPAAAAADVVTKSLRFNNPDTPHLSFTPSSTGDQKKWTSAFWFKRSKLSYNYCYLFGASSHSGNNGIAAFYYNSSDKIQTYYDTNLGSGQTYNPFGAVNNRVYRDPAGWMQIIWAVDAVNTTQRIWINGVEETLSSSLNPPNYAYGMNESGNEVRLGCRPWETAVHSFDGYMAQFVHLDGQYITDPTEFGQVSGTSGEWEPIELTSSSFTYGTNGALLEFLQTGTGTPSSTTIGADTSGNDNHWSVTNLAASDVVEDTPTNNYCVWNAVDKGGVVTLSEGNTQFSGPSSSSGWRSVRGTIGVTTGKYYFECYGTWGARGNFGVDVNQRVDVDGYNTAVNGVLFGLWDGYIYTNGVANTGHTSATSGTHTIGIAFDADSGKVWFRVDGGTWENSGGDPANASSSGSATFTAGSLIQPLGACYGGYWTLTSNSSDWEDAAPTGFKALSTANLPTPTIAKGGDYFNTKLYSGSGAQTGVGFQPDLVWVKSHGSALSHKLTDSVRGATKSLESNSPNVEATESTGLTAFGTDGFTVGADGDYSASAMAAWCWKKSTTAGFGIATYTGTGEMDGDEIAVAHGCGGTPEFVIVKDRDGNYGTGFDWIVWHHKLSTDNFLLLNSSSSQSAWDSSYPLIQAGATNNTFGIDSGTSGYSLNDGSNSMNGETDYVVYSMRSVAGFSQFGKYTGNSSADGPFVSCGFRPAFVLIKNITGSYGWFVWDTVRNTGQPLTDYLYANTSAAEATDSAYVIDVVSNGFKPRAESSGMNNSSYSYIYAAFAEAPFKYANAR